MKLKKHGFAVMALMLVAVLVSCVDNSSESSINNSTDNFIQINQNQYKTTFNDLRTSYFYKAEANQKGDVKVLVVPVEFDDYLADGLPAGRVGTRHHIDQVVFGEGPDKDPETLVQWESLRSFYDKSSYGQTNMTGYVADWWRVNQKAKDFGKGASVQGLISEVSNYYANSIDPNVDPVEFDANKDGFIDLTILVYSCPTKISGKDDDVFWRLHSNKRQSGPS